MISVEENEMTLYIDLIARIIHTKICAAKLQSVLDGQKRETNHYIGVFHLFHVNIIC